MNPEKNLNTQDEPRVYKNLVLSPDEEQEHEAERLRYLNEMFEGPTAQQVAQKGREKIHEMFSAGKNSSAYYLVLSSFLMKVENGVNTWKPDEEIDTTKLEIILKRIKQEEVADKGKELLMRLYREGKGKLKKYLDLHHLLAESEGGNLKWKDTATLDEGEIERVMEASEDTINFIPETKEKVIETPEMLTEKEASKKFFAIERNKIASEVKLARKAQRERMFALKQNIEGEVILEGAQADKHYGELSYLQSSEADSLLSRVFREQTIDTQSVAEESDAVEAHIDNSERLSALKEKVKDLYVKSEGKAREHFESTQKSVEQVLLRNNAFIVHTFLLDESLRHNKNSNILGRATLEDDIDILLSLEPSISTSSVVPGSKQGLWGGRIGVVLGGGDVNGVAQSDDGTVTAGIKGRSGTTSSVEEIDQKVSDTSERGYNELVVNNPEVFGFFVNVKVGEDGQLFDFTVDPTDKTGRAQKNKDQFMRYINLAISKGLPPMVMTPDRRLFEFTGISDNGAISVGKEITPEDVAKGNAGMKVEKRKELGKKVISKNLFKYIDDQKQAKEMLGGLSGDENLESDLSVEEYVSYLTDNPGSFRQLPESLLDDKEFMMKTAHTSPVSAYENAGEGLKKDIDFVKLIYSLRGSEDRQSVYYSMPEEMKKDPAIALLAIENNDTGWLDSSLSGNPLVWGRIIDKQVDDMDPSKTFSREVGQDEIYNPSLSMWDSDKKNLVNVSEKLLSDPTFIDKLKSKYQNFSFEIYYGDSLLVKKLA